MFGLYLIQLKSSSVYAIQRPGVSVDCVLVVLRMAMCCQSNVETKSIGGVAIAGLSFAMEILCGSELSFGSMRDGQVAEYI